MIRPTLNINGSSAFDLVQPRRDARDALLEAIEALMQVKPHGRDYMGDTARCVEDIDTHFDRLAALHTLREELLDEALHIGNQARVAA
jgi:hypothetical protein